MLDPAAAVNLDALPELATVSQVAAFLQAHEDTVTARIAAGALPAVRAGEGPTGYFLVPRESIRAFLASRVVRRGPVRRPALRTDRVGPRVRA